MTASALALRPREDEPLPYVYVVPTDVYEDEEDPIPVLRKLGDLADGWNGPGSVAPNSATLRTAEGFARAVGVECRSIAPTQSGEILFEWDLAEDISVYCAVGQDKVAVSVFDGRNDYLDLELPPDAAAQVAVGIIVGRSGVKLELPFG